MPRRLVQHDVLGLHPPGLLMKTVPEAAPDRGVITTVVDMFESLRTIADIPQAIVLRCLPGGEVRSAELALLREDGTLDGVASFGIHGGPGCPRQPESVWSSNPRAVAARTGVPVVMALDDGSPGFHVCVPVTTGTTTFGVLSCFVDTPEDSCARLAALTLSLFAGLLSSAMAVAPALTHVLGAGSRRQSPTKPAAPAPPTLSPRQLDVLLLMSQGLTNAQMASRLRFSESTIRMETIAIYRALGVHSRKEAIDLGRELELIPDPSLDGAASSVS